MESQKKGAEANLYVKGDVVEKVRVEKKYRHPHLDGRLRKQRTRREAKNLKKALEAGVNVPKVLHVSEKDFTLTIEYLGGVLAKDVFDGAGDVRELSQKIGVQLRMLHDANLVHNDLTTSNLIVRAGRVYMIDFGLSYHTTRLEDRAMDLVVFKKSIDATHTKKSEIIWENLINAYDVDEQLMKRVKTIEERVRYK